MKFSFFPQTSLGRWSAVFAGAFMLAVILIVWFTWLGVLKDVPLGLPPAVFAQLLKYILAAIAAGAAVTGVLGMFKGQERSVSNIVTITIGVVGLYGALQ